MNPKSSCSVCLILLARTWLPYHFSIPKNLQTLTLPVEYFYFIERILIQKRKCIRLYAIRVWAADNSLRMPTSSKKVREEMTSLLLKSSLCNFHTILPYSRLLWSKTLGTPQSN